MVLQSPDLSDETFQYVREAHEHELIVKVLDTPMVHRLQQQLFRLLTTAETLAEVQSGVIAGVGELMAAHHKLLAHEEVGLSSCRS
jgi:hypothetical protein